MLINKYCYEPNRVLCVILLIIICVVVCLIFYACANGNCIFYIYLYWIVDSNVIYCLFLLEFVNVCIN